MQKGPRNPVTERGGGRLIGFGAALALGGEIKNKDHCRGSRSGERPTVQFWMIMSEVQVRHLSK